MKQDSGRWQSCTECAHGPYQPYPHYCWLSGNSYVIVFLGRIETLVLITGHDVEMVHCSIIEVVEVLAVCTKREIALENFLKTIRAVIESSRRSRVNVGILLTLCNVGTQSKVETQVLKAMQLVIEVCATDKFTAVCTVILEVQQSNRLAVASLNLV